jgi:rhodanese-related sulfurtransferase
METTLRFLERLGLARLAEDSIDAAQAKVLEDSGALIIDVREPYEWEAGHVPGARNIPLRDLPAQLPDLPADGPLIFMCQTGVRSLAALRTARASGRADLRNLGGGIGAWQRAGLPIVKGQ